MAFYFRNLKQDPCFKDGESTSRKIKFTTCVENQFTCNDGECIDIEQRFAFSIGCILVCCFYVCLSVCQSVTPLGEMSFSWILFKKDY